METPSERGNISPVAIAIQFGKYVVLIAWEKKGGAITWTKANPSPWVRLANPNNSKL
jgi:hypothetical protein